MNELNKMNSRILLLNERFLDDYIYDNVSLRHTVFSRVLKMNSKHHRELQFGVALRAFLNEKKIQVKEYDLLAGQIQYLNHKDSAPLIMSDDFDPSSNPQAKFNIFSEITNYYLYNPQTNAETKEKLENFNIACNIGLFGRWNNGHLICGFENILHFGISGLISKCDEFLPFLFEDAKETTLGIREALLGLRDLSLRYASAVSKTISSCNIPEYIESLQRIKNACECLANRPPQNFFEAIQLIVLTHEAITSDNISGSLSIGRIDQWLYPFYDEEKDSDEAPILIDALWLKFAHLIQGFQNVTLGGCDSTGKFSGNILTRYCLQSSYKIRRDQPLISFRYNKDTPDEYWDDILNLIKTGIGFPALFNDDIVMKAKLKAGVDISDVWRYSIVGCVEPSIEGDEYANTEQLRINWPLILGIMLSPEQYPIRSFKHHDLSEIRTFDELYSWYKDELLQFSNLAMDVCDLLDSTYGKTWPEPLLSALMNGCIEKGKDVTQGCVKYSFSSINSCGMADTVDSLMAIKKLVFEKKIITLPVLGRLLSANFRDSLYPYLASQLKNKFGNDDDETDLIMKDLVDTLTNNVVSRKNIWGNKFQIGFYSVDNHAIMGTKTGALPNGREAGKSLANALSPCQGADWNGPTSVINSVTKLDMTSFANGMVLDLKFNPSFLASKERMVILQDLIKVYFDKGGMEIQFNVVDRDTLLDAQIHPEKHKNLIVRVSGFSAYFITLNLTLQNEIIERTENSRF